jgi:hypothetical protein
MLNYRIALTKVPRVRINLPYLKIESYPGRGVLCMEHRKSARISLILPELKIRGSPKWESFAIR